VSDISLAADAEPLSKARAVHHLWRAETSETPSDPYLYFLIDAARDRSIYPALRRLAEKTQIASLYQGATAQELAAVAPYLIALGEGGPAFDWLWQHGWGEGWGVWLWAFGEFAALRGHLRTLTRVRTEDGPVVLFRFYDPRVLPPFLGSCDRDQIRTFFGPVTAYSAETRGGAAIEEFSQSFGALRRRVLT
jgi:hypothetical protein